MFITPDSSSNHHSPISGPPSQAVSVDSSPSFPPRTLLSPWAQVVRGSDAVSSTPIPQSTPMSSSPSSSSALAPDQAMSSDSVENSNSNTVVGGSSPLSGANDGNGGRSKKPVWNKLSNGVVLEAGPVMGAESWPALSESTKVSGKLQPESLSSKIASEGSSLSSSQAPLASHSSQKQATSNAKLNSSTSYNMPNRQRSMKRGGVSNTGSGPAESSFSNPPPPPPLPPPFPVYQRHPSSYGIPDHSPRDHYRNNNWDTRPPTGGFVPAMNGHRGSSRRGNFGPHPRGDGSYHNNYGSRRDKDRGNYANSRDAHVHQPRIPPPRGLLRHPSPNTAGFVAPQPIGGPFPNPAGFPEYYYFPTPLFDHFKGMPFITHGPPPALFFPAVESPLTNMIVSQIDYYFSEANLVKDEFLRSNMDEHGWVPVTVIADFPRVRSLTNNIQVILDSMRASTVVEVQGDKLRRHNEWEKWVPSAKLQADSASVSPVGSRHNLAADFQTIALENATTEEGTAESFNQSQLPNGDAARNTN
ncbi:hypothetical protein TanjilG_20020 [Lupinus angustifolius]|uniref:HTH La-type RNA-binding domain-containing protein n=1 Tax=Lupinus angustifolius TaxID=3871 RepID=A0A4P1RCT6_LUPAN|nr:PREDICTED: la-related protein 1C-like [Lupinus angustifolius]OIW07919.1 hypothetical protein TanjilG_20020 [Lupinus angustifolius]